MAMLNNQRVYQNLQLYNNWGSVSQPPKDPQIARQRTINEFT